MVAYANKFATLPQKNKRCQITDTFLLVSSFVVDRGFVV